MSGTPGWLEHVDLVQWAQEGVHREVSVALDGMSRLDMDRSRSAGQAHITLVGSMDVSLTERCIHGRIRGRLPRTCQRCLGPMDERVDCEFLWFLARSESEYRSLDERHESVLLCDEPQNLMTLIEDELILSVALAPAHDQPADCDQAGLSEVRPDGGDEASIKRLNPFAVLRNFKND